MSKEAIYVRYIYLTHKYLKEFKALEKVFPYDVALECISKEDEVPLPPSRMRKDCSDTFRRITPDSFPPDFIIRLVEESKT